ncbi:MAG: hypothetical protein DRQ49_09760 [Gammaproteobacteria bacterium]|nr:MAG: hypothetical protein DRQ49_09760 [Gammaproteobacteria bacterium]RKZ42783.1 MAG: hypothetical protein DRQ41_06570 [Gammaproteobacteria bacterium]
MKMNQGVKKSTTYTTTNHRAKKGKQGQYGLFIHTATRAGKHTQQWQYWNADTQIVKQSD